MKSLTSTNLKNALWETLNELKSGAIESGHANAIATQSREILRTISTQLKISSQSNRDTPVKVIEFSEE